jgi:hypothetical protein
MSRWILLAALCVSACAVEIEEPRVEVKDEEDVAEPAQELLRKCSVLWNRQVIFDDGYYDPDIFSCCRFSYQCLPCDIYSCTFP